MFSPIEINQYCNLILWKDTKSFQDKEEKLLINKLSARFIFDHALEDEADKLEVPLREAIKVWLKSWVLGDLFKGINEEIETKVYLKELLCNSDLNTI